MITSSWNNSEFKLDHFTKIISPYIDIGSWCKIIYYNFIQWVRCYVCFFNLAAHLFLSMFGRLRKERKDLVQKPLDLTVASIMIS